MHQNVTTMTEDVEALHENVLFLKELFEKIDQVEVRIYVLLYGVIMVARENFGESKAIMDNPHNQLAG